MKNLYIPWEEFVPSNGRLGYELKALIVVITGSRSITDKKQIGGALKLGINSFVDGRDDVHKIYDTVFILGGAKGVDTVSQQFAEAYGIEYTILRPKWKVDGKYDARAGMIRNSEMVKHANHCISIWDGKSSGTKQCYQSALKKGIPCFQKIYGS